MSRKLYWTELCKNHLTFKGDLFIVLVVVVDVDVRSKNEHYDIKHNNTVRSRVIVSGSIVDKVGTDSPTQFISFDFLGHWNMFPTLYYFRVVLRRIRKGP